MDVGANVGVYVLQFAHWSGPQGKVVAFEPNPTACAVLQRHIEINRLSDRVQIVSAAVAAENGEAVLYAAEADGMSRLGEANKALLGGVKEIRVPVLTIDGYCKAEGVEPDWLFIDIEGFEISALAGAEALIEERRGELGIIVEMHPNVWRSANTTRVTAEQFLAKHRLQAIPLTGQTDPLGDHGLVHLAYL
jgi:FkbM family methyltransferase